MLKRIVNEARFTLGIQTEGPLLIRAGTATPYGPDMTPVRTSRNGEWQVFVPGSSLKGAVRSHAEKIVRTLKPGAACNPFLRVRDALAQEKAGFEAFCGDRFEQREKTLAHKIDSETAYHESCPICRLFGSTEFIGRVSLGDAYLDGPFRTELRDGVGLDRLTGGAAHGAKFDLEAVSSGVRFRSSVHLRNFECWQLGLLLAVVMDLEDGLIRLGGGRSRGFGAVKGNLASLEISHLGVEDPGTSIWGLGRFLGDESYGTRTSDFLDLPQPPGWKRKGLRRVATLEGEALTALRGAAMDSLLATLASWVNPTEMGREQLALGARGGRRG